MRKVTLRNLAARKLRLLLSAFAIVLGVAFVAGSLVFTNTMARSFDNIVEGTVSDVMVRNASQTDSSFMDASAVLDVRTIDASVVDEIAALEGVARADGSVEGSGIFVMRSDGTLLGGQGAPTLAFNDSDAPNMAGETVIEYNEGRAPAETGEVALDGRSANIAGYSVGDTVTLVGLGDPPTFEAELVGIAEFVGGGTAGATLVLFDTQTAQDLFLDGANAFNSIGVAAEAGVSQDELAERISQIIPAGTEAVTGEVVAAETQEIIDQVLGFLNIFLLVFAAIALVVGTFLIVNTFSMLVAQRSRELALLRAMGAGRGQVSRSVLTEAAIVGLLGSTLGLLGGFGLAAVLRAVVSGFGLDLSSTGLVFSWSTVVISYLVGVVVTMFAAYLPARRASSIPPIAAMRDDVAMPESSIRTRLILGVVAAILGGASMAAGLWLDVPRPAAWVGVGVFLVLMAVAMTSPVLAVPVLTVADKLYTAAFGSVGHLAAQNARRNPRRTAATASALMIGLALVTTMATLGSSVNRSVDVAVDEQFTTDFLVANPVREGFTTAVAERIEAVDGVSDISVEQSLLIPFNGDDGVWASALDPQASADFWGLDFIEGSVPTSSAQIAFNESAAESSDVAVGDVLQLQFPATTIDAEVSGIYADTYVVGSAMVPFETVTDGGLRRVDTVIAANVASGADIDEVDSLIREAVSDFPMVTVQTQQEFSDGQRANVNQILYMIYALLGLAIIIAVLGIVNTLALSVIERTREVGLVRAMGMSRAQLRSMVLLESIAIAVLGALLGIAAGLLFGVVLQRAFVEDGITHLLVPGVQLVVFVLISALVGVLAAVLPARRAAKLNVLQAIATE